MTNTVTNLEGQGSSKDKDVKGLGIILLAVGIFTLLGRFLGDVGLGLMFLPLLAAGFLSAGLFWRTIGFIIPGGIIAGIGTGALLIETLPQLSENLEGAIFMSAFAAGWVLVSLLGSVVEEDFIWWPFIPAGVMSLIALAALGQAWANNLLSFSNMVWPLAIISVGAYILLKVKRS